MLSVQEHSYYTVMWTAAPTDEAVTAAAAAAAVAERRAAILLARSCAAACQQQGLRTKLVPSMPEPTNFMAVFDVSERHSRARSIEYHPHLIFGFGCSPIRTPCGCGCFGCRCIGSSSGILHHKQLASSTLSTQISGRSHEQEGAKTRSNDTFQPRRSHDFDYWFRTSTVRTADACASFSAATSAASVRRVMTLCQVHPFLKLMRTIRAGNRNKAQY